MGGHPLVSDIWKKSHFLWPGSDFLQARIQVSTNKGGIEVGEALTSSKGKHAGFLPLAGTMVPGAIWAGLTNWD